MTHQSIGRGCELDFPSGVPDALLHRYTFSLGGVLKGSGLVWVRCPDWFLWSMLPVLAELGISMFWFVFRFSLWDSIAKCSKSRKSKAASSFYFFIFIRNHFRLLSSVTGGSDSGWLIIHCLVLVLIPHTFPFDQIRNAILGLVIVVQSPRSWKCNV